MEYKKDAIPKLIVNVSYNLDENEIFLGRYNILNDS